MLGSSSLWRMVQRAKTDMLVDRGHRLAGAPMRNDHPPALGSSVDDPSISYARLFLRHGADKMPRFWWLTAPLHGQGSANCHRRMTLGLQRRSAALKKYGLK
jgi:hypothetical protein